MTPEANKLLSVMSVNLLSMTEVILCGMILQFVGMYVTVICPKFQPLNLECENVVTL